MKKHDFKLVARYVIIIFFLILAWDITRPEYIEQLKGVGDITASSIYASVLGVLGWVVKSNWGTNPTKE